MDSSEATIYCSNALCQVPSFESDRYCLQCGAFLPKHYLWAIAQRSPIFSPGDLLSERYVCKQGSIFLDTKPGLLPESLEELPHGVVCYQRLVSHWLHVPQVYALLPNPQLPSSVVVLLENAPIYPADIQIGGAVQSGALMPGLEAVWREASSLQQLHWFWQMAQLWEPLNQEGVAASLLSTENLRVEGSLIRLLSLVGDYQPSSCSLVDLGTFWQQWQFGAQTAIAPFLSAVCEQMQQGQISHSEQLIGLFDQAIAVWSQAQSRVVEFATLTDQGPTRQRNEDACYPASGMTQSVRLAPAPNAVNSTALVVVCDGIGGHEGGNIASNLAIATVQQRLQPILSDASSPDALTLELKRTAIAANDTIVQRNDTERRQERQRMGTTLVMALVQNHELYLTHVGDSRAYRITRTGCHQVTLDDDLASREVRMGYGLYRDALRQPSSGSLVQALGMNASMLHPTVQRFILDEECLFLLCSDGLSDNDLIEEYWQTMLVPVLEGTLNVPTAVRQLVAIANQQNGHDNVTVGLLHCRVDSTPPSSEAELRWSESLAKLSAIPVRSVSRISADRTPVTETHLATAQSPINSTLKTQLKKPARKSEFARSRPSLFPWLLGLLILLGAAGSTLVWLFPSIGSRLFPAIESTAGSPDSVPASPAPSASSVASPSPSVAASPFLTTQSRVLVNRGAVDGVGQAPVRLQSQLASTAESGQPLSRLISIPVGTVLEVAAVQVRLDQRWLQLKVCSLPTAARTTDQATPFGQPGDAGWIQETAIAPLVTSNISLTPVQLGACAAKRQTATPSIETN
ncbi:protein phosphatase 2C domain-containing protein [Phormidium sp. CLA17]|uniref:protein phosphatase 2C domain-containing protein n=1 Tax=Leptolyngbya sp. Cla-17 TaxID=2803751 RepID=UPI001491828A|nr:protein phosphatase 2C domain-containing protein [Leptolyngbya sp. Cla-17]MBM0742597.1 protein phosphatase 2C domain-containing protein [Leptolyngbya sp. Cla-17]